MLYFAYGSNMLTKQITHRTPSAKYVGIAKLINMEMVCNKKSQDGSGKANVIKKDSSEVWGVLFEIPENELICLDKHEKGYDRRPVKVFTIAEEEFEADCYFSDSLTDEPPFKSYKAKIIKGAKDHKLPPDYIEFLKKLPSKPDKSNSKEITKHE